MRVRRYVSMNRHLMRVSTGFLATGLLLFPAQGISGNPMFFSQNTQATAQPTTAPAYRQSSLQAGSSTNICAPAKPTGTAANDIVIVGLYVETTAAVTM